MKCENSSSYDSEQGFIPLESYIVTYFKENCSNYSDGILYKSIKFKTSNDAHLYYISYNMYLEMFGNFEEVENSINVIGDESVALGTGLESENVYFYFRIANVVCFIAVQEFSAAYDISKIIEDKINLYLM